MSTIVQCVCKKKLRAGDKLAGKRVKCPNCGEAIQIPRLDSTTLGAPLPSSRPKSTTAKRPQKQTVSSRTEADDIDKLLDSPADDDLGFRFQDDDFEPARPKPREFTKPNFSATSLPATPTSGKKSKKAGKKRHKQSSQIGALLLGSFLACIGAVLGIVLWVVVLFGTQYEIGWIWWGMGALTGIGMQLGIRDSADTELAGIFAALIAFGAFALVKGGLTMLAVAGGATAADVMSPLDLLFVFLAVSSAYKIGSGNTE